VFDRLLDIQELAALADQGDRPLVFLPFDFIEKYIQTKTSAAAMNIQP
jgi:hypothetical protein